MILTLLIIAYLLLVFVEVFGEVVLLDYHGLQSYMRLAVTILLAVAMGLLAGYWYGVLIYSGLRLVLFDMAFGYFFKGDIWYLGTTSKWDTNKRKLIDKIKSLF